MRGTLRAAGSNRVPTPFSWLNAVDRRSAVPKGRSYQSPGQVKASAASVDAALGTRNGSSVATKWRP